MTTIYNRIAAGDVGRIAALSNSVPLPRPCSSSTFTRRALGHAPQSNSLAALSATAPLFLTWLMSLMTLGIFWVGQQTQLNRLARADRDLLAASASSRSSRCCRSRPGCSRPSSSIGRPSSSIGDICFRGVGSRDLELRRTRADFLPRPLARAFAPPCEGASSSPRRSMRPGCSQASIDLRSASRCIFIVQLNYAVAPRLRVAC